MLKHIESLFATDPDGWKINRKGGYPETLVYGELCIHMAYRAPILSGYYRLAYVAISSPIFYEFNIIERFLFNRMLRKYLTNFLKGKSVQAAQKVLEMHQREADAILMEPERALLAKFEDLEKKELIKRRHVANNPVGSGIARGVKKLLGV